jgi:phage terminase large subunit-like protein
MSRLSPTLRLPHGQSKMSVIAAHVPKKDMDRMLSSLSDLERTILHYQWDLWARSEQTPPPEFVAGTKHTWLILGGRGMGKTRPGSEQVIAWAEELGRNYGKGAGIALIGKDPQDIRDVMIEGPESGILACSPPWFRPVWEPTKKLLTWPNGVLGHTYSSEVPDDLRGPQHHKCWGDEPAKWKNPIETWDNLQFGLRLGDNPQSILTGTPRPTKLILLLIDDPDTVITRGQTKDNEANLSPSFLRRVYRKYAGTRLGRQELNAEVLTETPGALWTLDMIDETRVQDTPPLKTIVIAIDPGVTDPSDIELADDIAETGICAVGQGEDGHTYVLNDLSGHYSAAEWGAKAVTHSQALMAQEIIGEQNNGGDLVQFVVQSAAEKLGLPFVYRKVWASRGKRTRAEPVSARMEQKRQHHAGVFAELEDQMTTWVPGMRSPDRLDAMVWGSTAVAFDQMVIDPPAGPVQVVRLKGF